MLEQQQKKMFKFVAAKSTCMQDGQQMHLSKVAKKQNIDIGQVNDYSSFFNFIISECPTEELAYISCDCTPDKKTLCASIINKWEIFQKKFWHDPMIKFSSLSHILKKQST